MPSPHADTALPTVRLKNAWRSSHPWIFQRLVEKPAQRLKPGSLVDVAAVDGTWIGRGFYNGHSRIALRILETDPDVAVDAAWFARRIAAAVELRREVLRLDEVADAWRVVHSEGDGLSGLVVDRYADLLVVEFFSAGMYRHREWIFEALRGLFPGCRFHAYADEHVQKQESFDYKPFNSGGQEPVAPAIITEHGIRFRADPAGAHKTGFFADQRDNREWLSRQCAGKRVLDLCCNTGGFAIYAAVRGAEEVVGVDIDAAVLEIARGNVKLNGLHDKGGCVRFVQADLFPWLRDAALAGERYDVVILDPAKMTRDREQVIPALKKYLDMNKLALGVVRPGGLLATFSCTGLVSEDQFLDMLRRAAYFAGRSVQVLKVAGAGADHPFLAHVPESRYLKAAFCRVLD
ncbi:MAG: class I SAM-dependent rRNA methyltransferase [Pseudomonadota bacterium]|nr:class I SAM-dependent rRNA methyltransferase [Pseudomonadota bacterium]